MDPQTGSVLDTAQAAGIATGMLRGTPGIPSLAEAAFLFFGSSPKPRQEDMRRLIAWMPKDMAASPQEAAGKLRDIWTNAVATALPGVKVEYVDEPYESKPLLGRNTIEHPPLHRDRLDFLQSVQNQQPGHQRAQAARRNAGARISRLGARVFLGRARRSRREQLRRLSLDRRRSPRWNRSSTS